MRIELAGPDDVPFLWLMLTYAASMVPGGEASVAEAQADPYLRTYVDDWGRPDDLGLIAFDDAGARAGAVWVRAGLIVAQPGVPELAMATLPEQRGRGVGTALMTELVRRESGRHSAIVLSVREANPARRLYQRLGFEEVGEVRNRSGSRSLVMRLPLAGYRGP